MGKRDWLELVARGIALYFLVRLSVDLVRGVYFVYEVYAHIDTSQQASRLIGRYLAMAASFGLPAIWLWIAAPWLSNKLAPAQQVQPSAITASDAARLLRYCLGIFFVFTGLGAVIG